MKLTDRMAEIINAADHRGVRRNVITGGAWQLDWFVPVGRTVKALKRRGLVSTLAGPNDFEFLVPSEAGRRWLAGEAS